jgi:hypothetical protein
MKTFQRLFTFGAGVKTRPVSEGIEKVSAFRVKNRLPQLPQDAFLAAS